jgi:hypothetical protein
MPKQYPRGVMKVLEYTKQPASINAFRIKLIAFSQFAYATKHTTQPNLVSKKQHAPFTLLPQHYTATNKPANIGINRPILLPYLMLLNLTRTPQKASHATPWRRT